MKNKDGYTISFNTGSKPLSGALIWRSSEGDGNMSKMTTFIDDESKPIEEMTIGELETLRRMLDVWIKTIDNNIEATRLANELRKDLRL